MATPNPGSQLASPAPPARNGHAPLSPALASRLVLLGDPNAAAAEAYRALAVSLQFSQHGKPLRAIAVTSPSPADGRTTTAANLALAFAEIGQSVVLLDADLRRPSLHQLFGVDNRAGLTTRLSDPASPLPLVETGVRNVRLVPAGPDHPSPVELLGSPAMTELLEHLREQADMVLVDTPPAATLADATLVAPRVDGVLLVVRGGRTNREAAVQTRDALQRVQSAILGVVLREDR